MTSKKSNQIKKTTFILFLICLSGGIPGIFFTYRYMKELYQEKIRIEQENKIKIGLWENLVTFVEDHKEQNISIEILESKYDLSLFRSGALRWYNSHYYPKISLTFPSFNVVVDFDEKKTK